MLGDGSAELADAGLDEGGEDAAEIGEKAVCFAAGGEVGGVVEAEGLDTGGTV